jgi:hypothetical protein
MRLVTRAWAKGLTKQTDARVARAALAHTGLRYIRRIHRAGASAEPVWTAEFAYAIGLAATDGCLSSDGRHINFKSNDEALVATFLSCLGRSNKIQLQKTQLGCAYFTQFSDVGLYRCLLDVGLTPRKSLTLGPLRVPEKFVVALARGLLDGDGSVMLYEYAGTGKAKGRTYLALRAQFISASRRHIDWLQIRIEPRMK